MEEVKLIIEFMGWEIYEPTIGKYIKILQHYVVLSPYGQILLNNITFKKWNRIRDIMLVIRKDACEYTFADQTVNKIQNAFITDSKSSKSIALSAIVDYIKWYNKEKKG